MKKLFFLPLAVLALLGGSASPAVEARAADGLTLKVYSWEDYIYEQEEATDAESVIAQFETWATAKYGETVTVEYSTFDTNETMYNQVAGLGESFDLICPSEYMIQKMAREGLLLKYDMTGGVYDRLPNYEAYASKYLRNRLEGISISGDDTLDEYAAGYMWGTMGLIYNPNEVAAEDMTSWSVLWDTDYRKQASVKDSMRETYLVGLIETFKPELEALKTQYELDGNVATYNAGLTDILNRRDATSVASVEATLKELKQNIYGLEVDSGKNDIVTGKVDINVAWSGDAVYSMDIAEEPEDENEKVYLNYSVPEEASNVWFDGWVMPIGSQTELSQDFVDFLSDPEKACLNMDYIGYTSFIAGDEVLARVEDVYGDSTGEASIDLTYFFDGTVTSGADMVIETAELGRQFQAQYPSEDIITRCIVMEDFGTDNALVVEMWSNFKATTLSAGVYIGIGVAAMVVVAIGVYFFLKNKKSKRQQRRKANAAKK
jgi:spermidine/putrescine transport system substrate-binding protein